LGIPTGNAPTGCGGTVSEDRVILDLPGRPTAEPARPDRPYLDHGRSGGAVGRSVGVAYLRRRGVGRSSRGARSDDALARATRAGVTRGRVAHDARRRRRPPREASTVRECTARSRHELSAARTREGRRGPSLLSTPARRGRQRENAATRSIRKLLSLKGEPLTGRGAVLWHLPRFAGLNRFSA
jgi:hypothetical protein